MLFLKDFRKRTVYINFYWILAIYVNKEEKELTWFCIIYLTSVPHLRSTMTAPRSATDHPQGRDEQRNYRVRGTRPPKVSYPSCSLLGNNNGNPDSVRIRISNRLWLDRLIVNSGDGEWEFGKINNFIKLFKRLTSLFGYLFFFDTQASIFMDVPTISQVLHLTHVRWVPIPKNFHLT